MTLKEKVNVKLTNLDLVTMNEMNTYVTTYNLYINQPLLIFFNHTSSTVKPMHFDFKLYLVLVKTYFDRV